MSDHRRDITSRAVALVVELGLGRAQDVSSVVPLTGGVASDIARVDVGGRRLCVKFALGKLKVAEDWRAPVHRNKAEYAWLEAAARIAPEASVALFGWSEAQNGFAMAYLDGTDTCVWKAALLGAERGPAGKLQAGVAAKVAALVGRIHAASATPGFCRAAFHNRDDFNALRLDPYLRFTAERHPEVAGAILTMVQQLYEAERVLVHGDVSPKNIMVRGGIPILLDAECATMGDASFDPAFCLNHLVLKACHMPSRRHLLLVEAAAFWRGYSAHVSWEDRDQLERRVATLLPMLMLARIDGKSPVEYLSAHTGEQVRGLALGLIKEPRSTVAGVLEHVSMQRER